MRFESRRGDYWALAFAAVRHVCRFPFLLYPSDDGLLVAFVTLAPRLPCSAGVRYVFAFRGSRADGAATDRTQRPPSMTSASSTISSSVAGEGPPHRSLAGACNFGAPGRARGGTGRRPVRRPGCKVSACQTPAARHRSSTTSSQLVLTSQRGLDRLLHPTVSRRSCLPVPHLRAGPRIIQELQMT
jgi:hypothetical protein